MFNPKDDLALKRLNGALKKSLKEMEPARKTRYEAYRERVGKHGASHGTGDKRPVNLIELATTIYLQKLIAAAPRAAVTAKSPEWKADAASFKLALDARLEEDDLQPELETWVQEAMFSPLGVLKVSLDVRDVQELDGEQIWTGPPKAEAVLFDDWVQDMSARSLKTLAYCGNRYQVTKDYALNGGLYDPEVVKKLPINERRHESGEYSSQDLSRSQDHSPDDYRDMLELWDIWLPDEGLVLTLSGEFENLPPLRIVEWSGPKRGPYHYLYFGALPGNSLPMPPVSVWLDLNDTVNHLWNKIIRQAESQKDLTAVETANGKDADTIKNANDQDIITLDHIGGVEKLTTGGANQVALALVLQAEREFDKHAGNLSTMGGLAAMSGTVGQDELLSKNASERIQAMQAKVYMAMRGVVRDYGSYLWSNPLDEVPITKSIEGTNEVVHTTWSRQDMGGEWYEYAVDVEPFSLQVTSPAERLSQIRDFWRNDVLNGWQVFQAAGYTPDVESYVDLTAELLREPRIRRLLISSAGTMPQGEDSQTKPNTTTRRYERVNRSTRTPRGSEDVLMANLLGGAMQPKEQAMAMRQ